MLKSIQVFGCIPSIISRTFRESITRTKHKTQSTDFVLVDPLNINYEFFSVKAVFLNSSSINLKAFSLMVR